MGKESKKEKKASKHALPEHLELQRTHLICGHEMNTHTRTITSANVYMPLGIDNAWDIDEFKQNFRIKINKLDREEGTMQFDLVGVDPAVANALRRILIAEIPTVAIEHVFVVNNTSIIQDEVLAHRLGLVPLLVDPALLEMKTAEEAPSEKNTLVFKMEVTCRRRGAEVENGSVLSSSIQWLPGGSEMPDETGCRFAAQGQANVFSEPPRPVHDNILVAKMRPGQTIQLEAHAIKGIGKDHAKWSPVATAWYNNLPEMFLLKEPDAATAAILLEAAPGLFVRDKGKFKINQARDFPQLLEKVRALLEQPAVAEVVQYRKRKDYFIFNIESSGVIQPDALLTQALDMLHDKAHRLTTVV
eukprot:CAMPEP_0119110596 /NCGR_PEP_ID=MMETSP1180-20130426/30693_1 /TAXON_ID=3052 ORGANISM="Chlamydomonas cf sp, Strain CCMP681" /NCGR_SAMPLE_ID=MMETSP1180 /ASSEMBLY_ACC=CAM_ASM_000741 /LENGTH=358 /DNA_ID=CAMNT_0007097031 /DNA_START=1 /DNA_END=1077 /DNA_ORIENTATION=-